MLMLVRSLFCLFLVSGLFAKAPEPVFVLVYGFSYAGQENAGWMATVLSENATADLSSRPGFAVVANVDRKRALAELSRQESGLYAQDPAAEQALELGRLVRARYILLGSYSLVAGRLQILARLVRTTDGLTERSYKTEGRDTDLYRLAESIVPGLLAARPEQKPDAAALALSGPPARDPQIQPPGVPNASPGIEVAPRPSAPARDPAQAPNAPDPGAAAYDHYACGTASMYSDPHAALACFERALEVKSDFADAAINAAFVASNELNDHTRARELLGRARAHLSGGSQEATFYRVSGLVKGHEGRAGAALVDLKRSLTLLRDLGLTKSPDYAYSLNNIGNVYYKEKRYALAMDFMNEAIALLETLGLDQSYKYAIFLNNRGALRNAMGQKVRAREDVEGARLLLIRLNLESSSFGSLVHANLADLYADSGHFQRSILHKEKVREIRSALRLR
ncbi:MAG: tetratricopeptide repeat protein [Spirochaetales bacterium]|nr:tetratricopeptide repeat protein [Spirochaetales bacterium]